MTENLYLIFACALGVSFFMSAILTDVVRRLAIRWQFLDHPGERKMQREPVPLMGGVAICLTFYAVILAGFFVFRFASGLGHNWLTDRVLLSLGEGGATKLIGILVGGLLIFLLGIVDDVKALRPEIKLAGQIVAAAVLVRSGMRIELFILSNFWISALVTILWVVTLTNALNFLDNMDGLAAGISVIASFALFLCVQPHEQFLVRLILMVFAGAVAGFLFHNVSPARIFMGDAGALFCGYILATVGIMGTFHVKGGLNPASVAAPLLALSVPLFDIGSVVYIRWRRGESVMKGDKRHFSHRLVDLGMSPRQAVEFIYLVAAVTGLGAVLLPRLGYGGTIIILAQTAGIFLLIVVLMNAGKGNPT